MYPEDELLPLSGVQHLVFCERQAALIHVEGAWADNSFTVEGGFMHQRVHESAPRRERRGSIIIVRGLALRSLELGLVGVADVVEFHRVAPGGKTDAGLRPHGVPLPGATGLWIPFPVEYKRGRPKPHRADEVQLCAQALCLEEMLGIELPDGALFYGKEQRRMAVVFDEELRNLTVKSAIRFHELVKAGVTPQAVKKKQCASCSLLSICMPEAMSRRRSARRYLAASLHYALLQTGDEE